MRETNVSPTCTYIIQVMILGVTLSLPKKQSYNVKNCKRPSTSIIGTPLLIQFPFYDLKYPLFLLFFNIVNTIHIIPHHSRVFKVLVCKNVLIFLSEFDDFFRKKSVDVTYG